MSVNVGEDGQRSVQVEVEVPGTPEQVWQAIATGPGISSWFVPAKVDGRIGGEVALNFGPGMETSSTIAEWDPPHRFLVNSEGMMPGSPSVADEWTVEAKAGGTCVVRVVHSWFASTDEWDGQFEAVEQGWGTFFQILRLVLTHFPGQPSAGFQVSAMPAESLDVAWKKLTEPFGVAEAAAEQEVSCDEPLLKGTVATPGSDGTLVLLREPAPGICNLSAMPMGDQVYVLVQMFLFGDAVAEISARAKETWERWLEERFPAKE